MAELLLALESEEIPARMQSSAAQDLVKLLTSRLASLNPKVTASFWGPRRFGAALTLNSVVAASIQETRGPRCDSPQQALEGFLRKHNAKKCDLVEENSFWILRREIPAISAEECIAAALPDLIWKFPWLKSMRWGVDSQFTWVRPLHRIVCVLDGKTVPFTLATPTDAAHGLAAGAISQGHPFCSPAPFNVESFAQYSAQLCSHYVILSADERIRRLKAGLECVSRQEAVKLVEDPVLLEEVSGLTEWPQVYSGKIDARFMTLPAEVLQISMRTHQRYFAYVTSSGEPAGIFAFAANADFAENAATVIAGNERVLRARFADAQHFWDLDRQTPLDARVSALENVTFHAKLGSQAARVRRLRAMAAHLGKCLGVASQTIEASKRAAFLSKSDLTTGMVGEFPELQGIMGGYYAREGGEPADVAQAISEQYLPRGLGDRTPCAPASICVGLADRLDLLAAFFSINEAPSGSGDPFGLRRAALGVYRIIRENSLRLSLGSTIEEALKPFVSAPKLSELTSSITSFIFERIRVQLRSEGKRHDILSAVLTRSPDDDIVRLLARAEALTRMLETDDGHDLLAACRRAANILRIENKKDGPHYGASNPDLFRQEEERALALALSKASNAIRHALDSERFEDAMRYAAELRPALDHFFGEVTVNDPDNALRLNRLRLLGEIGATLDEIADLAQIAG